MTCGHSKQTDLQDEQGKAFRAWETKEKELVGYLAKLFWLAGLVAGAERDALEEVLGGEIFLPDADIEAAESWALSVTNDASADKTDQLRVLRALFQLTRETMTAHGEAGSAATEFVHAMEAELRRWCKKDGIER